MELVSTQSRRTQLTALLCSNALILGVSLWLGPLGAILAVAGIALMTFVVVSELGFVVLITTISHLSDDMGYNFEVMRAIKWLLLAFALLVTIWQFTLKERWPSIRNGLMEKYIAIFILWGLVCLCFADSPRASVIEFGRAIAMFVVYFVTRATMTSRRRVWVLLALFIAIAFSSSLYSLFALSQGQYFRVRGFTNNPGAYAQIMSFILPFVVVAGFLVKRVWLRHSLWLVAIIGLLAMFLAWSRASIIGAAIQIVVYLLVEKRYRFLAFSSLLLVGLAAATLSIPGVYDLVYRIGRLQAGTTHRTTLWHVGLQSVSESLVVGHGFEVEIADILPRVYWNDLSTASLFKDSSGRYNPHNQYLQSAVATGIPGLLIFLGFMYYLIRNGIRDCVSEAGRRRRHFHTAMLSISISLVFLSFFANAPMFASGSMANYFWIAYGMVTGIKDNDIEF